MGYSNDYREIRNGFINYIGAALNAVKTYEKDSARQYIVAMLIEEAINLATNEDDNIDLYSIKPLLKGCKYIFQNRITALESLSNVSPNIGKQINEYKDLINTIDNYINNITK